MFAKRLKSIIIKNDPTSDLKVIYQTTNTTKHFFPTKDSLTNHQKSGVVYQIICNNCNHDYIGKMIRQVYRRLGEHEKDVVKATMCLQKSVSLTLPHHKNNQRNKHIIQGRIQKETSSQQLRRSSRLLKKQTQSKSQIQQYEQDIYFYKPNSALGKHVKNTGNSIDFQNVHIINQDQNSYRLLIKESIEIRARQPTLNGTDKSVPLYVFPEGYRISTHPVKKY